MNKLSWLRVIVTGILVGVLAGPTMAQQGYDWEMPADQLHKFASCKYLSGAIGISFTVGHCVPIVIKELPDAQGQVRPAVTGLEVLAPGRVKVQVGEEVIFEDDIHAAMFRFHPEDYAAFVALEEFEAAPDAGLGEMLLHLCQGSFRRFWHRGMQAMVPDQGIAAAFVYSKLHGGVMLWQNARELVGYSMTEQAELFRR